MPTTTRYMPRYSAQSTQVEAQEVEPGDLLVEILPHHGIKGVHVEAIVYEVLDGPPLQGQWLDMGSGKRVHIYTHGAKPLLPVNHPVVIKPHL